MHHFQRCFHIRTDSRLILVTLTSAVSLWQFLHEQPMPEKALSGWSNLFSLALRKNVVKGSYRHEKGQIHIRRGRGPLVCVYTTVKGFEGKRSRNLLFWASTSAWSEQWSKVLCSGEKGCCHRPTSRSVLHKKLLAWDSVRRLAGRSQKVA